MRCILLIFELIVDCVSINLRIPCLWDKRKSTGLLRIIHIYVYLFFAYGYKMAEGGGTRNVLKAPPYQTSYVL